MKTYHLLLVMIVLLSCTHTSYGMATEEIGPDKDRPHPTVAQPGWPAGMAPILRHDSRVYSRWVNGNENFYFQATPNEVGELIKLYGSIRLREHVVRIERTENKREVSTFKGKKIDYNINFHYLGGIALHMTRREGEAETHEPTLTIYVDTDEQKALSKQVAIPNHIILGGETTGWDMNGRPTKPQRTLWHAEVLFDDQKPAADFENGLSTKVTLWQKDAETGFDLGNVSHEGKFNAALSEKEIEKLKAAKMWLTLTVGNYRTAAKKVDPKLDLEHMSPDPSKVKAGEVAKPRFYFGRLLFEDGSPAILDPPPWPGAEIRITFSYAGNITIDKEGYFRVFFTPEQFESLKAKRARKNIYIPLFETKGRSRARYAFPPTELSLDKSKAGELRIVRPGPESEEE